MSIQPGLFHRAQGQGLSFWGPGDLYTFLVTGEESNGAYFSMLAIVPPGGGPPPHIHLLEDETFFVLDGTPTFRLGDELSFVQVLKRTREVGHIDCDMMAVVLGYLLALPEDEVLAGADLDDRLDL